MVKRFLNFVLHFEIFELAKFKMAGHEFGKFTNFYITFGFCDTKIPREPFLKKFD